MNVCLNLNASLHNCKCIYNETVYYKKGNWAYSSGVLSISQPKDMPYCQHFRPKKFETRAKHSSSAQK